MEQPLQDLLGASTAFSEILACDDSTSERRKKICSFIETMSAAQTSIGDFTVGLEWFNCKEPLSFQRQLKGKIVILDFFTYCCINCLHILPHLRELEERFSVEDGVVVVGVHSAKFDNEKDSANILAALKRYAISHPVVNDCEGDLWSKLEIACWPTLLILGPKGQPLLKLVGEFRKEDLFDFVGSALKFFKGHGEILPHPLPVSSNPHTLIRGPLVFPGKIVSVAHEDGTEVIAISNSGLHSLIIATPEGTIRFVVGCSGQRGFVDGDFHSARFNSPQGLAFSSPDILYVADTENHAIRKVDLKTQFVTTLVGNGQQASDNIGGGSGAAQSLSSPWDLCLLRREVPLAANHPPPFLCICPQAPPGYKGPNFDSSPPPQPLAAPVPAAPLPPPPPPPSFMPIPPPPPFAAVSSPSDEREEMIEQEILIIAMAGSHQIWAYFFQDTLWWGQEFYPSGACANIAGSGVEANRNNSYPRSASFAQPSGLSYCPDTDELFIADSESSSIRCINMKSGKVSAVVGGNKVPDDLFSFGDVDGDGHNAKLQHPLAVAWHKKSGSLFVADSYNHKIKSVDIKTKLCSSFIGTGFSGNSSSQLNQLNEPSGLCVSADESKLYIADTNNHCIKVFEFTTTSLRELNLQQPVKSRPPLADPCSEEIPLKVNFGGKISFLVNVVLAPDTELTEGAPQRWTLKVPDMNWEASPLSGTIDPNSTLMISVKVPSSPGQSSLNKVFLSVKVFCCSDGACKAVTKTICFSITHDAKVPMVLDQKVNLKIP